LIEAKVDPAGDVVYSKHPANHSFFFGGSDSKDVRARLSTLWAHQEIERLAKAGRTRDAVKLANVYRIVSSVSGAVVLERQSDYDQYGLNRNMNQSTSYTDAFTGSATAVDDGDMSNRAPHLQGATNGTLGPQGNDATVIVGVNSPGTVRVNNAQNLETTVNLIAAGSGPLGASGVNWLFATWAAPVLCLLAIPLFLLNVLPPLICLLRGTVYGITRKPGAGRLILIGASWAVLAFACPLASQALALVVLFMLNRRKKVRKAVLSAAF
jgi:hypothetical protein